MKIFVILSALLAIVSASPAGLPAFYTAEAPILRQYHAQDELGQYAYGYNGGLSAKVETKSIDGVTRGTYSYVDSNGLLQTVEYTADALNGFRAAATNLPRAPIDNAVAPEPVRDTPEVVQARADHMAAYNEAVTRTATSDTVETVATPIETIATPIAPITPIDQTEPLTINAGQLVALRNAEYPRAAFAYHINTPAYAYTTGQFYTAPYQYTYAAPILTARSAPLEFRSASVNINPAPVELRVPAETPEVALARAEHLAAVEKEKARIATFATI